MLIACSMRNEKHRPPSPSRVRRAVSVRPQFLVTRSMEDFVTWVDGSKIKRAIKTYEDKVDDFDLLGEG